MRSRRRRRRRLPLQASSGSACLPSRRYSTGWRRATRRPKCDYEPDTGSRADFCLVANAIAGLRVVRKVKAIAGPSCDFRAEQGQWSRRRDARMTTKARLRRPSGADPSVAAPRPKRPDFDAAALGTPRHSSHARQRCYLCLIAIARLRSCGPRAALLRIVVGSSQRLDVLARERCSLHTKSASA